MGAALSSKTNRHSRSPKNEKAYKMKVRQTAENIVHAVKGGNGDKGFVYEHGEEALFIVIALQIGIGPGKRSDTDATREGSRKNDRDADRRSGFRKFQQGDNQKLVKDAVDFALKNKSLQRYDDPDGIIVGLYITKEPPKWNVVLKTGAVENWIPTKRDMQAYLAQADVDVADEYIWTDRDSRLLRSWGEQFR